MPRDVVVLFVHGINTTYHDYYKPLLKRIVAELPEEARSCVVPRPVFWGDIVRGRTEEYLYDADKSGKFKPHKIHHLAIGGLGDAAAYQKTEFVRNSAYYRIQAEFRKALSDVALSDNDTRPLVVIAHSLGCHITSTYAWDLHKYKDMAATLKNGGSLETNVDGDTAKYVDSLAEKTPLERLDTFAGFITMGCNMPLFTFTFGQQRVFPITCSHSETSPPPFPGSKLETSVRNKAKWLNFYSLNDPLGFPLKPLNQRYADDYFIEDRITVSEGPIRKSVYRWGLRPLASEAAHSNYWWDRRVAKGAADVIRDIMYAGRDDELFLFPGVHRGA